MTDPSWTPPSEPSLGEVLHAARVAGGEQRPRPWPPESWADRDPELKRLDEAMAAAVADRATADLRSRLGDADNAIGQVIRLAESALADERRTPHARQLARALLEVLGAWTGERQERTDEKEAGSG